MKSILCLIGIHRWSTWIMGAQHVSLRRPVDFIDVDLKPIQVLQLKTRKCRRACCGKVQTKLLVDGVTQ